LDTEGTGAEGGEDGNVTVFGYPGLERLARYISRKKEDIHLKRDTGAGLQSGIHCDSPMLEAMNEPGIAEELGVEIENHWVRFKVDNSGELFGSISPSSSDIWPTTHASSELPANRERHSAAVRRARLPCSQVGNAIGGDE
jgi:hypothetical protein